MTEPMIEEAEAEEFSDEMYDEALDREQGGGKASSSLWCPQ